MDMMIDEKRSEERKRSRTHVSGGRDAPKSIRTSMETLLFSREEIEEWQVPEFQRPIRVNAKVMEVSETIKTNGGIIPGILTLGRLTGNKTIFIVDGQHRTEAFKISNLSECIADVRTMTFDSMADMADEFVRLNGRLVTMRPDDILRSMAQSLPALRRITENCEFVGYGQVRRGNSKSAIVSMSALLRCWYISTAETPVQSSPSAPVLASMLDNNDADKVVVFMNTARAAWGTDPENYRLWGALNLIITMWLWRRLVIDRGQGYARSVSLLPADFQKCLMSVSAEAGYLDWLVGRSMTERDRSPCFTRLKAIFIKRLNEEKRGDHKLYMPNPSWASR